MAKFGSGLREKFDMDGYILVSDGTTYTWQPHPTIPNPEPEVSVSGKCPCCGSRQFVTHQSRRVCSYCRSEQDGQVVVQAQGRPKPKLEDFDFDVEAFTTYYGNAVLRPELAVRITQLTEGKTDGKES